MPTYSLYPCTTQFPLSSDLLGNYCCFASYTKLTLQHQVTMKFTWPSKNKTTQSIIITLLRGDLLFATVQNSEQKLEYSSRFPVRSGARSLLIHSALEHD